MHGADEHDFVRIILNKNNGAVKIIIEIIYSFIKIINNFVSECNQLFDHCSDVNKALWAINIMYNYVHFYEWLKVKTQINYII